MSVVIKGYGKPSSCLSCPFNHSDCWCGITKGGIDRDDYSCDLPCPIEPLDAVLDEIKAKIEDESYLSYDDNPRHIIDESWVLEIIDKYREESDIKKRKELSHKPCINYEDGCEEWAGCPRVHYIAERED